MRKALTLTFLIAVSVASAQPKVGQMDSLRKVLYSAAQDTLKIKSCLELAHFFEYSNPDTAFKFSRYALTWSRVQKFPRG